MGRSVGHTKSLGHPVESGRHQRLRRSYTLLPADERLDDFVRGRNGYLFRQATLSSGGAPPEVLPDRLARPHLLDLPQGRDGHPDVAWRQSGFERRTWLPTTGSVLVMSWRTHNACRIRSAAGHG